MRTDKLFRFLTILALILVIWGIGLWIYTNLFNSEENKNKYKIRIAVIDSKKIEREYQFFKDIRQEMERMNTETDNKVVSILKGYEARVAILEKRQKELSPKEIAYINKVLKEMEKVFYELSTSLTDEMNHREEKMLQVAQKTVRDYIIQYNKKAKFDYILKNNEELFYFRNQEQDITEDIIRGLNAQYKVPAIIKNRNG